jgi:hypothetical protein
VSWDVKPPVDSLLLTWMGNEDIGQKVELFALSTVAFISNDRRYSWLDACKGDLTS